MCVKNCGPSFHAEIAAKDFVDNLVGMVKFSVNFLQFKKDKEKALDNYMNALSQGGTRTLPELYKSAGLEFNFAPEKIRELMEFVKNEMINLEREL